MEGDPRCQRGREEEMKYSRGILAGIVLGSLTWTFAESIPGKVLFPKDARHVVVYYEPGRFGGWPANNGCWSWGNEILVGFSLNYFLDQEDGHSYDRRKPSHLALARSLDGGETWQIEIHDELEADEQQGVEISYVTSPIDFSRPGFALRARGGYFHYSYDRGRSWHGPYTLPTFFGRQLTSRTDYLVVDKDTCYLFLSVKEPLVQAGIQDRAFCVRTRDGGLHWEFMGWMTQGTEEDPVFVRAVMPATVQIMEGHFVSALRRRLDVKVGGTDIRQNWIDLYRSDDWGRTWHYLSRLAYTDPGNEGHHNGNPPSLVRLEDGRLLACFGYRGEPYGIRARISRDDGKTWGRLIHLRDDGRKWDLGYCRTVVRPDGKVVTIYYFTTQQRPEMHIAATIWDPDRLSSR